MHLLVFQCNLNKSKITFLINVIFIDLKIAFMLAIHSIHQFSFILYNGNSGNLPLMNKY